MSLECLILTRYRQTPSDKNQWHYIYILPNKRKVHLTAKERAPLVCSSLPCLHPIKENSTIRLSPKSAAIVSDMNSPTNNGRGVKIRQICFWSAAPRGTRPYSLSVAVPRWHEPPQLFSRFLFFYSR